MAAAGLLGPDLVNLILRTAAGLAASQYRRRRLMLPGTAYVYLRQNTEALLSFSSFLLNKQKGMDGWDGALTLRRTQCLCS